jgi:hypothetical protein
MKIRHIEATSCAAPSRIAIVICEFANLLRATLLAIFLFGGAGPVAAVEVGEQAPEFTMPSTMGGNISLSDYRGKKWVLLEFYGADFAPT